MRVTRIRKAGQRCYSELGASRGAAAFSREKLSVFVRGHFWRVGTVLFCVRGTVGGESVCKGRTKLILCVSLYSSHTTRARSLGPRRRGRAPTPVVACAPPVHRADARGLGGGRLVLRLLHDGAGGPPYPTARSGHPPASRIGRVERALGVNFWHNRTRVRGPSIITFISRQGRPPNT